MTKSTPNKKFLLWMLLVFISGLSFSQTVNDTIMVKAEVKDGDTLLYIGLPTFTVESNKVFGDQKAKKAYYDSVTLHRDVLRAYDYAKQAAAVIKSIDAQLAAAGSKKQEKAILDINEKKLKAAFEDKIKSLTKQQGDYFVKLIYRETGKTCFDILKDYKGGLTAFSYQNSARMSGLDLKDEYHANGADKQTEEIILAGK